MKIIALVLMSAILKTVITKGSAKLLALRVLVPCVSCVLRALVSYMPRAPRALMPYVPCALRALVPDMPRALRASCPTCLVPHVLLCFT